MNVVAHHEDTESTPINAQTQGQVSQFSRRHWLLICHSWAPCELNNQAQCKVSGGPVGFLVPTARQGKLEASHFLHCAVRSWGIGRNSPPPTIYAVPGKL